MALFIMRCASATRAQQRTTSMCPVRLNQRTRCSLAPQQNRVGIFWDLENCGIPTKAGVPNIVSRIREIGHGFGAVDMYRAYSDISLCSSATRAEITAAGVCLVDRAHHGQDQVADGALSVDMIIWASEAPAATILLITGDGGFTSIVAELRLRGYTVVVISPTGSGSTRLKERASKSLCWHVDICGRLVQKNKDTSNSSGLPLAHKKSTAPSPAKQAIQVATISKKKGVACSSSPLIPSHFQCLVTLLERLREEGTNRSCRGFIAAEIVKLHPNTYIDAGVTSWKAYAILAEKAGLVELVRLFFTCNPGYP
ncbi:hypothetical protein FIBSPDRAFT_1035394 [Athelia psychrophila]|uniref:NYN domain-containing protein n=1 Tax=Athelia psychrophila TaxID=1759441 RepID=A0A166X1F7_9AGAM|nr:hypothetical protein FIBSPDRAFT_1035394 [Fibularhizoctonia sp. CBS 109695]